MNAPTTALRTANVRSFEAKFTVVETDRRIRQRKPLLAMLIAS
jgi:hypothetical protein